MKNHRNFIFYLLACILIFQSVHGQNAEYINRTLQDFASEMRFGSSNANGARNDPNVEGSEFLDENFVNGDILTLQHELFKDIPMRYNAYRDRVEVKLPDGIVYHISDPTRIFQILLKANVLVYSEFSSGETKASGFLFELYNGKSTLYCRNMKIYKERIPSNGIIPETPARVIDRPREYYISVNGSLPRIVNSKKELLELLGNHASQTEDFIKKHKVKLTSGDDLIKVLTYYDSL